MAKQPSKATRKNRSKFAKWIWENQVKPIIRWHARNRCEKCGASGEVKQLHCHHIDGRQNMYMLICQMNIVLLCANHHTMGQVSAHSESRTGREEFDEWLVGYKGKEIIDELARLRGCSPKLTLLDLEGIYQDNRDFLNND